MATTLKVLGQVSVAAATDTTLYTVPGSTQTVVSDITVANRSTATTIRIAIRPAGAAIANQHYIAFDLPIGDNEVIEIGKGITLGATDVVTVRAAAATVTFNIYGQENS